MKGISRSASLTAVALLGASLFTGAAASATSTTSGGGHDSHDASAILRGGIAGSLPSDPLLFDVKPGGAPWVIDHGSARLGGDGTLRVAVRGLVIPTTGVNPVPTLAASVICSGAVIATTSSVPFSGAGDAQVSQRISLPDRCLAPAVLLNPNGNAGVFIGATGGLGG